MNNKFFRSILAGLSAVSIISAMTGCSSTNSSDSSTKETVPPYTKYSAEEEANPDTSSKLDQSLQNVYDNKKLVIGFDTGLEPMSFTNTNNDIIGFDIDVAQEVCNRMGIELVKQPVSHDKIAEELNAGRIDCIWNGLAAESETAASLNLSSSYLQTDIVIIVPTDSDIKTMDDLSGKTIGVQKGSYAQEILEASDIFNDITESLYDDNTALEEMETGSVDAVCLDIAASNYFMSQRGKNFTSLERSLGTASYVVGFRMEDMTLRDEVQNQLYHMKEDDKLIELSQKWFDTESFINAE